MEITFSYTPTVEDRRLEIRSTSVARLRYWWLAGAPLSLAGVGVLAKLAASRETSFLNGCAALAAVIGILIMVWPYRGVEEAVRKELRKMSVAEREVTLSETGIRVRAPGVMSEVAWSRVYSVTETPTHWRLAFDSARVLHLPKRSVGEAERVRVSEILGAARRR